jgi:hypothetical protein
MTYHPTVAEQLRHVSTCRLCAELQQVIASHVPGRRVRPRRDGQLELLPAGEGLRTTTSRRRP